MSKNIYKLAVIGMAGQGKSTTLNALAKQAAIEDGEDDDEEEPKHHFKQGSKGESCTKELKTMVFNIKGKDGRECEIHLTDTMGFPDPDFEKAKEFYDKVIEGCNQELNGIVWIIKPDRKDAAKYEKLEILMKEFNRAKANIFLLVNGCEAYEPDLLMKKKALGKKKAEHRKNFEEIARDLVKEAGVAVMQPYIVGADMDDLYNRSVPLLIDMIQKSEAHKSEMRTLKQVYARYEAAKSDEARAKLAAEDAENKHRKEQSNLSSMKALKITLEATAATAAAGGAIFCWVPGAAAVGAAVAAAATVSLKALEGDFTSAIRCTEEALRKSQEALSKHGNVAQRANDAKRTFTQFQELENVLKSQGKRQKTGPSI